MHGALRLYSGVPGTDIFYKGIEKRHTADMQCSLSLPKIQEMRNECCRTSFF